MKDAKGHGSDSRGGENVGDTLYRLLKPPSMIPGYPAHQTGVLSLVPKNDSDVVERLRAGVMPQGYGQNVTRAPGWIERFGLAARRGRNPV